MRPERASPLEPTTTGGQPKTANASQLRIAERPTPTRAQRLVDLAFTLLKEAEFLARDKTLAEETARLQALTMEEGIDFYIEVERFEVGLIKRALEETAGNQARAARLLNIKPTTLNSKIKLYNIEF
jgi:transcriptional regulator with GAF, ATPase, and Fis domain